LPAGPQRNGAGTGNRDTSAGVRLRAHPDSPHRIYFPREYSWSMLSDMGVPLTLLGLLERGPSHRYDLKRDYDAYFGQGRPLRYSQVYATLSRLARDGKAVPGPAEQGPGRNGGGTSSLRRGSQRWSGGWPSRPRRSRT
jgi:hypothetical protein